MRLDTFAARFLLASAMPLGVVSCADANGRFQQFEDRRVALQGDAGTPGNGLDGASGAAGNDGGCRPPAPGIVHGPALLALEVSTTPGKPILFFGEVETPELGGATAVKYSYKALDALDRRTQVGESLLVGPYPIGDDGSFDAPTEPSTLPGNANASLLGVEITSELTLHGTICGVADFYCGTVTGTFIAPIQGPMTGQFGLTLVPSSDDIPARPRFGCSGKALAPALD